MPSENLRPTPNIVRETVFNWLGHNLCGLSCLDLFAGSGAMGFEAASRGAKKVILVEKHRENCKNLLKGIAKFNTNRVQLYSWDALDFIRKTNETFDVVFLDPPFSKNFHVKILDLIRPLVKKGSVIHLESNANYDIPRYFEKKRRKRAGQVLYTLLEFCPR